MRRFWTTFQVGKHCGVYPSTIVNWVNNGKLKSSQTPGGHRRIENWAVVAFCREYNYPIPENFTGDKPAPFVRFEVTARPGRWPAKITFTGQGIPTRAILAGQKALRAAL